MSDTQFILLVLILGAATALTRFLPFILFGKQQQEAPWLRYLGQVLPAAMMGLLVVYCFKDVNFSAPGELFPALIASGVVAVLHLWKRNTILSIAAGTAAYMILIRIL